jgi:endoglucanase
MRDVRPRRAVGSNGSADQPTGAVKLRGVRRAVALVGALIVLALSLRAGQLIAGEPGSGHVGQQVDTPTPSASTTTAGQNSRAVQEAGEVFLNGYVESNGRVVRRDQGGDTVSEGQAYAMLVAAALKDRPQFHAVWTWTKENLLRPDGLLAWRWQGGRVVDAESASDADLDAARALVIAAKVFGDDRLHAEGVRLAKAVLDEETVMTKSGRILVAGSWALRDPYGYNPSYASPVATAVLAEAYPDPRWAELDRGTRAVSTAMLNSADLPPDWAQVHSDGRVDAMPGAAGRGDEGVRYGYDAMRLPLRFAESCDRYDVAIAARLMIALDRFPGDSAVRDLGGAPLIDDESVVSAAGEAAALAAAGDAERATVQLQNAERIQQAAPTYYGAAWNALGRVILTTNTLGGCPPI